jgi:hypothetical protein
MNSQDLQTSELCHQILNLISKTKGASKAADTQLMGAISNLGRALKNYKNVQGCMQQIYEMCGEVEETIKSIMHIEENNND